MQFRFVLLVCPNACTVRALVSVTVSMQVRRAAGEHVDAVAAAAETNYDCPWRETVALYGSTYSHLCSLIATASASWAAPPHRTTTLRQTPSNHHTYRTICRITLDRCNRT